MTAETTAYHRTLGTGGPSGSGPAVAVRRTRELGGAEPVPALLDAEALAAQSGAPDLRVLHVDTDAVSYHRSHLPGALGVDAHDDLHAPHHRAPLSHPGFEQLCRRLGIRRDSHVVLYGTQAPEQAAYAFWLFRYYQHDRVSLLDGGLAAWLRSGRAVTDLPTVAPPARSYRSPGPDAGLRLSRESILRDYVDAAPPRLLLDCRSPREYAGQSRDLLDLPLDHVRATGHIPGARNLPASLTLTGTGTFQPREVLRELFRGQGLRASSDVALYCRTVERSSLLWFLLHEVLGHPPARRYDGGWAEYSSLVDAPVSPPAAAARPGGRGS